LETRRLVAIILKSSEIKRELVAKSVGTKTIIGSKINGVMSVSAVNLGLHCAAEP
jgi:hypothetical protein